MLGWAGWEYWTWPDVARLARERPVTTTFIEDHRARLRAEGKSERMVWTWTPYAAISPSLKRAVLVSEDIGFFSHHGFALKEMQNAVEEALREGGLPRGASTITQQLAKNLFLSGERAWWRKAQEAAIAVMLETILSKRRILEIYLNVIEGGNGVFGAEAAARHHFGVAAANLTPEQAARLAAMIPSPRHYSHGRETPYLGRRAATILARMGSAQIP